MSQVALTAAIAKMLVETAPDAYPALAIEKSTKVIMDTFAAILSGAGSEVAHPLDQYMALSGESGTSPIMGTARQTSAEMAALVNGTYGHALDFDDVLSMMPAHPSAVIVAVLCADLQHYPLSGRAFIDAHIMGVEVGAKIGLGMTTEHYHRGFHGTGTLGIFCGVAALARAYRLAPAISEMAFGIAGSMASGIRRNFGTMTKPLHTGWAARSALTAVRLAMSGFTAAPDIFEAKSGFFSTYGVAQSDPAVALQGLGQPWVMTDPGIALKKFPCCYASHRGMDAVLVLRERMGVTADAVARLECRMPEGGMQVLTYPTPTTGLEGKFSLQYALAAGLLDGAYSLWSFSDEAVNRPAIRDLLQRVKAYEDPSCRGDDPLFETRSSGSRGFVEVDFVLHNGQTETVRVAKAPGHPSRELSWDELAHKFRDCAAHAGLSAAQTDRAVSALQQLQSQDQMDTIMHSLRQQ